MERKIKYSVITIILVFFYASVCYGEYSRKVFWSKVSPCMYTFYEEGMNTNLEGYLRDDAIKKFSMELEKLFINADDMPLNEETAFQFCENYKVTDEWRGVSKAEFIESIYSTGYGEVLKAFERSN